MNKQNIKNDIIDFYKSYGIDLTINKIIDSYIITTYCATLDTTKTNIKKIEKLLDDLCLYIGIKNINIKIDYENKYILFETPKKTRDIIQYNDVIQQKKTFPLRLPRYIPFAAIKITTIIFK